MVFTKRDEVHEDELSAFLNSSPSWPTRLETREGAFFMRNARQRCDCRVRHFGARGKGPTVPATSQ